MNELEFFAKLIKAPGKTGGSYIEFPYRVEDIFGRAGRVKVICHFDGVEYRGSLVKMGTACHIVGIRKDILKIIKKNAGEMVAVRIREDLEARKVEPEDALNLILNSNPTLKETYEKISYTAKREINRLLESSKKPETKEKRLRKIVEDLKTKNGC